MSPDYAAATNPHASETWDNGISHIATVYLFSPAFADIKNAIREIIGLF
jgi:hypothetical protein